MHGGHQGLRGSVVKDEAGPVLRVLREIGDGVDESTHPPHHRYSPVTHGIYLAEAAWFED